MSSEGLKGLEGLQELGAAFSSYRGQRRGQKSNSYPLELRERLLCHHAAGRSAQELSRCTGVGFSTIHHWIAVTKRKDSAVRQGQGAGQSPLFQKLDVVGGKPIGREKEVPRAVAGECGKFSEEQKPQGCLLCIRLSEKTQVELYDSGLSRDFLRQLAAEVLPRC